jgi:hypothetical protein
MAGANVLPIIDTSASMSSSGYVETTQTDSEAFVRAARPGDRIGVVSYDQYGRITYPLTGNQLVTVDFSLKQTREAADAIQKLSFQGACTNIGGGIQTARTMMDSAPAPKGLVLLSDGYQNCGTSPLTVLPPYPIYSCAMGPYSDQNLMREIATRTGGKYYFAPTVFDMMLIFNQIRGELDLAMRIVTNELSSLTKGESKRYPVAISDGQTAAQFAYTWNDTAVSYTPDAPGSNQIQVTLFDPAGTQWTEPPQVIGGGYVIFNIDGAKPGTWEIAVQLGTTQSDTVPVTAGGFEFGDGAFSIQIGDPAALHGHAHPTHSVKLLKDGVPLHDATIHVQRLEPAPRLLKLAQLQEQPVEEPHADKKSDVIPQRKLIGHSTTFRVVASGRTASGMTVQRTEIVTVFEG